MPHYKGREVEAFQIGSGPLPDWILNEETADDDADDDDSDCNYITIETSKGKKNVSVDDWVIRHPDGTLQGMKDEKFRKRYLVL